MNIFLRIINGIKLRRDYKRVFCPFFEKINDYESLLEEVHYTKTDELINIYTRLKESKKKKYNNLVKKFEVLSDLENTHNSEVRQIVSTVNEFDYYLILDNPLDYSEKVKDFYNVAERVIKYKNLNDKYVLFYEYACDVHNNYETIRRQKNLLDEKNALYDKVLNYNEYLDYNEAKKLIAENKSIDSKLSSFSKYYYDFKLFESIKTLIEEQNESFIRNNIDNPLFDNINERSLDREQRRAVLTDEVSNLVVAGAGSGKTLTICGKVEYLLKDKKISPNDILILSYSKKSADDLQTKIECIDNRLTVGTFHKIGLEILKETTGKSLAVEDQYKAIIEKYFREEIRNRPNVLEKILTYYGLYISSVKNDKKYENTGDMFADLKNQNLTTLKDQLTSLTNDSMRLETIKKEYVKSLEELAIANWYFIKGVDYIYEYPYEIDTSTIDRRRYLPDFYLPNYKIYHEHYGIDKDGYPHQYTDDKASEYIDDMNWKRTIHTQNETTCIESYSYEFTDGTVFTKLEKHLKEQGVEFHPLNNQQIFNALESIYEGQSFKSFINLIRSFLSLYKAKYRNAEGFKELKNYRFESGYDRNRASLFLDIVEDIYSYYKEYLRSEEKIDFDDMILESIESLKQTKNFKYRYILVDEFQDISVSRMLFLKELIKHGNSKLFAVGDDWQAIYRFSGCDLDIFLNFSHYFGYSKQCQITTTHRNSQELQDIAGPFVMANPSQIRKRIVSDKHLYKPIRIMYYSDKKYNAFLNVLDLISKRDSKANVLVLGRNNKDFESIALDNRIFIDYKASSPTKKVIKVVDYPDFIISYSTVHGSKGLEEDFVIVINAEDSRLGFPNKMEDDELLNLVFSSKEAYEFDEERRLWYVALTRTRSYTYLLVNNSRPSIFIDEIELKCFVENPEMELEDVEGITCPYCKTGRLIIRTNERDGYKFYGCSNYPYCKYTIDDFNAVKRNLRCLVCNDFLVYKKGKWGPFYGCHSYPRCDYKEKYFRTGE